MKGFFQKCVDRTRTSMPRVDGTVFVYTGFAGKICHAKTGFSIVQKATSMLYSLRDRVATVNN